MQNSIDEQTIEFLKNYYILNNKPIPTTVKQYEQDFPKGYGRTTIKTKFSLSCKQLLAILNNDKSLNKDVDYWLSLILSKFDIDVINLEQASQIRKSVITYACKQCSFVQQASIESLNLRKTSCTACQSGNAKIKDNPSKLLKSLTRLNVRLLDKLPENQLDKILVACNNCNTEFYVLPTKAMHPQTDNTGTCPNCRTSDRRVVYDNHIFGSQIERDVFIELSKYVTNIHRQVKYSSIAACTRKWIMDMYIGNTIIEVSNFSKEPHNQTYYSNLEYKKQWAISNGFNFIHISKVSEVKALVKDIV